MLQRSHGAIFSWPRDAVPHHPPLPHDAPPQLCSPIASRAEREQVPPEGFERSSSQEGFFSSMSQGSDLAQLDKAAELESRPSVSCRTSSHGSTRFPPVCRGLLCQSWLLDWLADGA